MAGIYDQRILGAQQQAETARKLREGITMPEGQMVSGHYVAPAWTQSLANVLRGVGAINQQSAAEKQAADLQAQKEAETKTLMQQLEPAQQQQLTSAGQSAVLNNTVPSTENMLSGSVYQPQQQLATTQMVQPSREQQMATLLRLSQVNPEAAQAPIALQEFQMRQQDRKDAMDAAAQQRKDQMAFKAQQAQLAREANFAQQEAMARLGAQLRPQQEKMIAVMGKDGNPIMVPQSQATGMTPYNAQTMKGEGTAQQRASDAAESNALLSQVEQVGNTATSSGIGRLRDTAAGFVGMSTPGADAAAKMKVLGASLTAKVPKMSGPQSDKDVAMYKEAAGNIADPTIPWSQKQAAINTIREINNRQIEYAKGGIPQQPSVPAAGGAKFLGFE